MDECGGVERVTNKETNNLKPTNRTAASRFLKVSPEQQQPATDDGCFLLVKVKVFNKLN